MEWRAMVKFKAATSYRAPACLLTGQRCAQDARWQRPSWIGGSAHRGSASGAPPHAAVSWPNANVPIVSDRETPVPWFHLHKFSTNKVFAMSQLASVTPEGVPVTINEKSSVVEEHQQDPLHVIAARSAEKQSTKIKETK